ncbi:MULTISPECIES: DHA2 family efflux MFS transporter permease subunit [Lactobacillus]|uniref:DHA2 family efflux MFS transporter permease subunit n=1 Tax=Lactobacillus xujianguonis TaxID=2495899 RepID=A0A437SSZ3_9LACO|nr:MULTISPECIES: DHA2 family efflux MFS transporter permease subunit [Lactobacillus]RVU70079.1 DHA2 family efflux MFS transporter permease subunit [Lactobacillus xujianguonis]RVU77658.1 DHA2 family efflux MFS transporter permease subunit [Lactobacillus xujianguonis]
MEEMNNGMKARVQVKKPWLAILPLMLGSFVGMFSETALNIALPQLMKALQVGQSSIQWLVTGYMLVIGIVLPLSSLLTKWFTTKKLVIFGLLAFIIGSLISGLGVNFPMVLVGRMIQGISTGIILPLMFTIAMLIFPPNKLGTVNGVLALVIMFAPAIGPTLTGLILAAGSWRDIFYTFVVFLVIALIIAFISVKNVNTISKPKIDWLSIILSIVAFSGLIAGTSFASHAGWLSAQVLICLIVGIIALILYCKRQLSLQVPVLNLKVFKHRNFTLGAILVMIDFGIILSAMYLLPQYLQNGLLVAVALTGIIMLPGGLINAITSALAGRMYDNFGAKWPARIGFLIAFVGAVMLSLVTTHSAIWYVILAHIILMIGAPLAMSPSQTSALNSLKGLESADGSAILNTMQQIVGALATALATSFLTMGRGAVNGSAAFKFTNGVHYGMYFTIALTVIGFIIALFVKDDGNYTD